jgi:hypothetical protein
MLDLAAHAPAAASVDRAFAAASGGRAMTAQRALTCALQNTQEISASPSLVGELLPWLLKQEQEAETHAGQHAPVVRPGPHHAGGRTRRSSSWTG